MIRALVIAAVAVACSRPPRTAPPSPPPFDAAALAAELDHHMAELAELIHVHRGDCARLARELRELFARMAPSLERARAAQEDPGRAAQLTAALRTYDDTAARRTAQIEADFTADATCARDPGVREALQTMPTL